MWKQTVVQPECAFISHATFPWINTVLLICTSDPPWKTALQGNLDQLQALFPHCKVEEKLNNGKLFRLQ
jgi:hypothetical protein